MFLAVESSQLVFILAQTDAHLLGIWVKVVRISMPVDILFTIELCLFGVIFMYICYLKPQPSIKTYMAMFADRF